MLQTRIQSKRTHCTLAPPDRSHPDSNWPKRPSLIGWYPGEQRADDWSVESEWSMPQTRFFSIPIGQNASLLPTTRVSRRRNPQKTGTKSPTSVLADVTIPQSPPSCSWNSNFVSFRKISDVDQTPQGSKPVLNSSLTEFPVRSLYFPSTQIGSNTPRELGLRVVNPLSTRESSVTRSWEASSAVSKSYRSWGVSRSAKTVTICYCRHWVLRTFSSERDLFPTS